MNSELFEVAGKNLRKQGVRTYLTLIGIVIGIAAIVALLSVGQGLNYAIEKQFESLGANTIFIIPGGQNGELELTDADISRMESVRGIESIVPIYSESAFMEFKGQKVQVSVSAADADKAGIFDDTGYFDIKEGRMLVKSDSSAILIGENIAENFFKTEIELKNKVLINGKSFRVVGILKSGSQTVGGGGPSTAGTVFMSQDAFEKIFASRSPGIIFAKTYSPNETVEAADKIKFDLEKKYGEKSVFVSSADALLEQVNAFLQLITIFLTGIAGISLIVGGVGITNAMIASVLERTKEIGLLKALGANKKEILSLFLIEAAFIGAIGGIIGIIIGYSLANLIAFVGESAGFALYASMTPEITLGALLFSMLVGMISGFYPALRAANLDPITALRYE
ncbi:MAG: ABC transporter permease [Candidatus Diapherotrites archaeon]|nr:ABC transporter permease [Candidatus Diapherotrites archaeon]